MWIIDLRRRTLAEDFAFSAPFSSPLHSEARDGLYTCARCGARLFSSRAKLAVTSGWPAFGETVSPAAVDSRRLLDLRVVAVACFAACVPALDMGLRSRVAGFLSLALAAAAIRVFALRTTCHCGACDAALGAAHAGAPFTVDGAALAFTPFHPAPVERRRRSWSG